MGRKKILICFSDWCCHAVKYIFSVSVHLFQHVYLPLSYLGNLTLFYLLHDQNSSSSTDAMFVVIMSFQIPWCAPGAVQRWTT